MTRERRIVELAAKKVSRGIMAKEWLRRDERGTWEKSAGKLLEESAAKAKELGLTEKQVDDEIAVVLAATALKVQLKYQQRKGTA